MAGGMKIFFDGGYRPEGMELAVVAAGQSHIDRDLGPGSAMDAEWLALLAAIRHAYALGLPDPVLLGDAVAVIAQANGTARCPPAYRHHLAALDALPRPPGTLRIRYIKRSQNLAGIALARLHER
jgi:ribonuclease HI